MVISVNVEICRTVYTVSFNNYTSAFVASKFVASNQPKTAFETLGETTIYIDIQKEEIECFRFSNGKLEIIFMNPLERLSNTIRSFIKFDDPDSEYSSNNIIVKFWLNESDIDSVTAFSKLFSLEEDFIASRLVKENIK